MTSFRFAVALIAMALVATPTVKATDLIVGDLDAGSVLGSASETRFDYSLGVDVLQGDEVALVADNRNKRIVNVSLTDGATTEFMSTGTSEPIFLVVCVDGVGYFSTEANGVKEFDTSDTPPRTASPWLSASTNGRGLACLKNSSHNLLFVADSTVGIRAYDRSNKNIVWEVSVGDLGITTLAGLSLSPDLRHLAFASYQLPPKVGSINLETKATQLYGSDTEGSQDGAANVAQFDYPYDVAWTPDGSMILVNQNDGFSGLRFIDFATGNVTSSANNLMPTNLGRGVTVVRSTGDVVVTYSHGLKKMQVDGVTAGAPLCGNVPTVRNSDGGNNVTTGGFSGDTVTYVCDAGFTAAGTSQITTCQSDTATWSIVSGCQSDADVIIALLGNSTDVKSTLEAVVKAFDISLCGGATSEVSLQAWCELREFQ